MNALLIALLTAGSTFVAIFPLMHSRASRLGRVVEPVIETALTKACRRNVVTIVRAPKHRGLQWCGSSRRRPCIRRR